MGRHPEPPKAIGGAQRQSSGRRSSLDRQRTTPVFCSHTIVHTEVQGQNRPYCSRQTVGQVAS